MQPKGLTLDELQKLGAKPAGTVRGFTLDELKSLEKETKPKKDLLQKTGDVVNKVFPGKKVGEAIGTLAGLGVAKAKGNDEFYDTSAPSVGQVAGDVVSGAAQVAGFKGVGVTGSLLQKASKSAAIGAGMFGGSSAAEGGDVGDVAKSAAIGAGVGGATSLAFSSTEAALKQFQKIPSRLIRSATGQSKKEILAGKSLEKFMLENKRIGTADSIIKKSQEEMVRLNTKINQNLQSVPITKAKITTSSILDDLVKGVNENGGEITKAEAKEIIERLAPQAKGLLKKKSMSLVTANKLRQSIDKTVGDAGFLRAELPFNKELLRTFTNTLRESVKTKAPDGTRAAFNSLSNEIRLSEALASKIAQGSRNQIISFGDLIGGGLGGAVGGVPGAIAGAGIRRAVQSTPALTTGALVSDKINKALAPLLVGLEPTIQTQILNALSGVLEDETKPEEKP